MDASQAHPLQPGKCELCRKPLETDRFALFRDHVTTTRSCQHLVCGICRGVMLGWRTFRCPNSDCEKPFRSIHDALHPSTASADKFFKFVNYTQTGRITKEELVDWFITNFIIARESAMELIDDKWHLWDVPKSHSVFKLGWLRSQDQGDLDPMEFSPVQHFLSEFLAKNLGSMASASTPAATTSTHILTDAALDSKELGDLGNPVTSMLTGQKRAASQAEIFIQDLRRNVAQRKQIQAEELQRMLTSHLDKGRGWFDHFDTNKSGELDKGELIVAFLQTLIGTHQITREEATSIVGSVWDAIDTDSSGAVHFNEFQILREALLAQLDHDKVGKVASAVTSVAELQC